VVIDGLSWMLSTIPVGVPYTLESISSIVLAASRAHTYTRNSSPLKLPMAALGPVGLYDATSTKLN
jgi:hypothetical protein